MTILISSHLLHQIQRICDRVGIIHRGKLVAQGSLGELSAVVEKGTHLFELRVSQVTEELLERLRAIDGVVSVDAEGDTVRIDARDDVRPRVSKAVCESGVDLLELKGHTYTLEEIYLRYFQE